jgi:hypothetical protein
MSTLIIGSMDIFTAKTQKRTFFKSIFQLSPINLLKSVTAFFSQSFAEFIADLPAGQAGFHRNE